MGETPTQRSGAGKAYPSPQQASRKAALAAMAEEIFSISAIAWQMRQRSKGPGRWDLSESEFLTLDLLSRQERLTVGQIQRQIGVLPAQMSRIIRALESNFERPLIGCSINPDDKRRVDVTLTEIGRLAHREFHDGRLAHTIEVLGRVSEKDVEDFMRVIRLIRQSLTASAKPGG